MVEETKHRRTAKRRARTAGPTVKRGSCGGGGGGGGGTGGGALGEHGRKRDPSSRLMFADDKGMHSTSGVKMKKSDVRYGNKEGGGAHFGSEERFAWQKAMYASDAMYSMPPVKAPPFSFGTSTREDWKKIMENTKDLHNPNGE